MQSIKILPENCETSIVQNLLDQVDMAANRKSECFPVSMLSYPNQILPGRSIIRFRARLGNINSDISGTINRHLIPFQASPALRAPEHYQA